MCNPNSSLANRRFRALSASAALRKNLGAVTASITGGGTTTTATTTNTVGGLLTQKLLAGGIRNDVDGDDAMIGTTGISAPYHDDGKVDPMDGGRQQYYPPSPSMYYVDGGASRYTSSSSSPYLQHYRSPPSAQEQYIPSPYSDRYHYRSHNEIHDPYRAQVEAEPGQSPTSMSAPPAVAAAAGVKKTKPKRRRKPQKPGLTAKV